ncbi:hypothetical protein LR48_Vigan06g043800 [Vigna angularis]|uniref:Uncharacterized protein n=1 Tax=Phaseolus angularis TaxID=3914 RepID=A0A0L9URC4_PHAAN|nr:hypothetical protein LR48_Vigan06g043800 [Vigna angularis]
MENLPGERDSLTFGDANIEMIGNQGVVELSSTGAGVGAGPSDDELAEVELGPGEHIRDLGEVGVEGNADDGKLKACARRKDDCWFFTAVTQIGAFGSYAKCTGLSGTDDGAVAAGAILD